MKIIFLLLFSIVLYATNITKTIDELIQEPVVVKVKLPLYDPFMRAKPLLNKKVKKTQLKKKSRLFLSAIMNDKAFINGKWYKEGQSSSGVKVIKISSTSVTLKKGHALHVLKLKTPSMFTTSSKEGKK